MVVIFGEGGFKYLDHDAYVGGGDLKLSILNDNLEKDSESGWTFVEQYLSTHLSRQLEYQTNHPEDAINDPLYTSEFYKRYNKHIGQAERYSTVDQLQLTKRLINHPKYLTTVEQVRTIQLALIGCGSGIDNVDANVITNTIAHRPSWLYKTTIAAIEPYPPNHGRNPYLNPYYEQEVTAVAQNPRELEKSDGAFLLGSPRMDILDFLKRLRTLVSLNTILKPGGFVAIDEACPATSMPEHTSYNAYQTQESWNIAFHPWMAEGFFHRTWEDSEGKFGKYFYAEPFEIYYTLMRQAGFKLAISNYSEIKDMFSDQRLATDQGEVRRIMARNFPPNDTFEHIFYQTSDTKRVYNRYVLFWEKVGHPNPEFIDFIKSFEAYKQSLRSRVK